MIKWKLCAPPGFENILVKGSAFLKEAVHQPCMADMSDDASDRQEMNKLSAMQWRTHNIVGRV